ncbi:hypothetical protein [Pseudomonas sp. MRSN 12121]|uniref:hypothetical protein n=1 Tax=Pseudomonas sp. MRSN 12121 TaxID=1611770 RepID=UPI0005BEBCAE|nr:hypothetical protein [Pseudomonas sp. MRSN 12121]AJO77784.1 hypothetical protein TO66_10930 [Pseudomonas sp. MRSN 12121]
MQSHDFVEGVSGWRLSKDKLELFGGPWPIIIGNLDAPERRSGADQLKPFIVVDGATYIRKEEVDSASTSGPKLSDSWAVNMELLNGKPVVAGIGAGLDSQLQVNADSYAIHFRPESTVQPGKAGGASSMLDAMASLIAETSLGEDVLSEPTAIADQVRDVLRAELKPGGMLWRR